MQDYQKIIKNIFWQGSIEVRGNNDLTFVLPRNAGLRGSNTMWLGKPILKDLKECFLLDCWKGFNWFEESIDGKGFHGFSQVQETWYIVTIGGAG